jgi:hypothetical protein
MAAVRAFCPVNTANVDTSEFVNSKAGVADVGEFGDSSHPSIKLSQLNIRSRAGNNIIIFEAFFFIIYYL